MSGLHLRGLIRAHAVASESASQGMHRQTTGQRTTKAVKMGLPASPKEARAGNKQQAKIGKDTTHEPQAMRANSFFACAGAGGVWCAQFAFLCVEC